MEAYQSLPMRYMIIQFTYPAPGQITQANPASTVARKLIAVFHGVT
jgi:hypothetical protein